MDSLEEYVINHSACGMPRCEYVENDIEIDCDECQKRMLGEHDAKVRAEAIREFAKWEDSKCINYCEFDTCEDVVKRYFKQLKQQNSNHLSS